MTEPALRYACDREQLPSWLRDRFVELEADEATRAFLDRVRAPHGRWVTATKSLLATFVSSRDSQVTRDYVELPPDFALDMVPVPKHLVGKTLAEARLPQTTGARVIEIKRRAPFGEEERVIAGGDTQLRAGDQLVLIGPTAGIAGLRSGMPAAWITCT